jgi:uncharacterized tellurite resistance protein B-like protein
MLKAIKRALAGAQEDPRAVSAHELRQVQVAVAMLLHEARRADYDEGGAESMIAERALVELFGVDAAQSAALMKEGRAKAQQHTSFYAPLALIKRQFSLEDRMHLVEHLWRISFVDGELSLYEDHYVRKIAHLLYVPNTQSMLARNRARSSPG